MNIINNITSAIGLTNKSLEDNLTFSEIIGYEDIKDILRRALLSEEEIAIYLNGPPASGKSLFMQALKEIYGDKCLYFKCSTGSVQAFYEKLERLQKKVKLLVFDELDKWSKKEQTYLYDLLETGEVDLEFKTYEIHIRIHNLKVFAAGNSTKKLNRPLLSRFMVYNFEEYTDSEFTKIVAVKLAEKEIPEQLIISIIRYKLDKGDKDVRKVLDVATLINTTKDTETSVLKLLTVQDKYTSAQVDYN